MADTVEMLKWVGTEFPTLSNVSDLDEGGFKRVLSVTHPDFGDVVLKLIPSNDFETIKREILAVKSVESNRVPKILDFGVKSGPFGPCFWFLEQRIYGESVRDILHLGPMYPLEVIRMGIHVLEALVMSEKNRIVHRDIKPDNIMRDNDYWLIDFGIARHLDLPAQTPEGPLNGKFTPGYAPQEQFNNLQDDIDIRADLFALGVTMYECITGENPFRSGARDNYEMCRRAKSMNLPKLVTAIKNPGDLNDFIQTLVSKRRDHRPESALESLEWLVEIYNKEIS